MEDQGVLGGVGREEEEDEFCSCCEDEEEAWKETQEEPVVDELKDDLDEFSVKLFFKGLSIIAGVENCSSGFSGIGVFMERASGLPVIRVQKKLDFYAEEPLVDYLALMDGLLEAKQNKIQRVYAFTDSELLYDQVVISVFNLNVSLFYNRLINLWRSTQTRA